MTADCVWYSGLNSQLTDRVQLYGSLQPASVFRPVAHGAGPAGAPRRGPRSLKLFIWNLPVRVFTVYAAISKCHLTSIILNIHGRRPSTR